MPLTEQEVIKRVHERFMCKTLRSAKIQPHRIDHRQFGHHASYCDDQYRYWGFESESGRDLFVKQYRAKLCA